MEYTIRTEIGASSLLLLSTLSFKRKKGDKKRTKKKNVQKGKGKGRGHSVMFRVLYEDGLEKRGKKRDRVESAPKRKRERE